MEEEEEGLITRRTGSSSRYNFQIYVTDVQKYSFYSTNNWNILHVSVIAHVTNKYFK